MSASASLIIACRLRKKQRRKRKTWVKNWLKKREEKSAYNNILQELRLEDEEHFRKYLRMNTATFEVSTDLLFRVRSKIT